MNATSRGNIGRNHWILAAVVAAGGFLGAAPQSQAADTFIKHLWKLAEWHVPSAGRRIK